MVICGYFVMPFVLKLVIVGDYDAAAACNYGCRCLEVASMVVHCYM